MNTKVIGISIAAVIGIIVLGSVLMPILNDSTAKSDTYTNSGMFRMKEYGGDDAFTASWDHTKPAEITINGEVVPIPATTNEFSIILDGNFFLRYFATTAALSLYYGTTGVVSAGGDTGYDMTIEYDGEDITFANTKSTPDTRVIAVSKFYSIANDGPFVMKKPTEATYANSDSIIYGAGRTSVFTTNELVGSLVSGTIEDPEVSIWRGSVTPSNITVNATEVEDHKDLYLFNSVTFKVTSTEDDTLTQDITYSFVVVPYEVTAERTVHFTDGQNAILSTIPIMIIVAILLGVVALVIRSRMN